MNPKTNKKSCTGCRNIAHLASTIDQLADLQENYTNLEKKYRHQLQLSTGLMDADFLPFKAIHRRRYCLN